MEMVIHLFVSVLVTLCVGAKAPNPKCKSAELGLLERHFVDLAHTFLSRVITTQNIAYIYDASMHLDWGRPYDGVPR
jgi:hypothetical protein